MDERAESDRPSDASDETRNEEVESDSDAGDDAGESSGSKIARAGTVGAEAAGTVVDAVLDAL